MAKIHRRLRSQRLGSELLEGRQLLAGVPITSLGIAGDSLSDEYAVESYDYARNWAEILHDEQGFNLGPQGSYPEPRRAGYAYNWARYGTESDGLLADGQHTGLAAQINAGLVSHAVLAIGQNDFAPNGAAYRGIALLSWDAQQIQDYEDQVLENLETALQTLYDASGFVVIANILDPGVLPATQAAYTPTQQQRVTDVINRINAQLLNFVDPPFNQIQGLANRYNVPLIDLNGMARDLFGPNDGPEPSFSIGGNTIQNAPGTTKSFAFVDNGLHPNTIVHTQIANLVLATFRDAYDTPVDLFTEKEACVIVDLNYSGTNTLNIDYRDYIRLPTNRVPALSGIEGTTVSYTENAASTLVAPAGVANDNDNLNFFSGVLTATVTGNATASDRLWVKHQGNAAGQIGISGVNISYGGVKIGKIAGGANYNPLTITLNANAFEPAVQALLRRISFQVSSEAPNTLPRTITFTLSDGDGKTSAETTTTVNVLGVNDAPKLNTALNPALNGINKNTTNPAGTPIDKLLGGFSDPDPGAQKGLAVVGVTGVANGTWQFTTNNGSTWQALNTPSEASARLLAADGFTKLRFIPKPDFFGQVTISYRAWDRKQGSAGGTFNMTGNTGGTKSFSTAKETATQRVNDVPVLTLSGSINYVHNAPRVVLVPSAMVADADSANFGGGRLTVRIATGAGGSNRLGIGGNFTVDANRNVRLGSTIIGTLNANGGQGTTNLIVTFKTAATKAIVQQLVRSITFQTVNGAAGKRTVLFSVTDGDGGFSATRTKTVNVT